jgi:hypothetical protein
MAEIEALTGALWMWIIMDQDVTVGLLQNVSIKQE